MLKIDKNIILKILKNIIITISKSNINFYTINKIINLIKYEIAFITTTNLSIDDEETIPIRPCFKKNKKKKDKKKKI